MMQMLSFRRIEVSWSDSLRIGGRASLVEDDGAPLDFGWDVMADGEYGRV